MRRLVRGYFLVLGVLGLLISAGAVAVALLHSVDREVGLLLLLGVVVSWLRFNLRPIGYVSLTPLVSFVGMLLYPPFVPVLIASVSSILGSRLFGKSHWGLAAEEAGEESLSTLLSVGLFRYVIYYNSEIAAFTAAAIVYAFCRALFTAVRGKLHENIALSSTVAGAGGYLTGNILLLAFVAFGITRVTPLYSRFDLLGLSLVAIVLVEFYRPWKQLSQQANDLYASLAIIAEAIDIKDPYTGRHSRRVAEVATKLARRMNLSEGEVNAVRIGALLHDIGKIGVSGSIIRKPGSLESTELKAMQRHPVISADIMGPVEYFREASQLVRHHHEHFDGTGYPDGLKGQEIPIGSRIILVADAFDAMTTDRPYRRGRSSRDALAAMKERAGRQFDPQAVAILEEMVNEV